MRHAIIGFMTLFFVATVNAKTIEIKTLAANDYGFFDSITSINVLKKTLGYSSPVGSTIEIEIKGQIQTRDCGYDSALIYQLPRSAPHGYKNESYLLTVSPIYTGDTLTLSPHLCNGTWMSPVDFTTKIKIEISKWHPSWNTREWIYDFSSEQNLIAKHMTVIFDDQKGWILKIK